MNTGSILLLFVTPSLIMALAIVLYFAAKEPGDK